MLYLFHLKIRLENETMQGIELQQYHNLQMEFEFIKYDIEQALTQLQFINQEEADIRYQRALDLYNSDKPRETLKELNTAIRLNPHESETYYLQGLCFVLIDKPQKAIVAFSKAIEINPDYLQSYLKRGEILISFNRHIKARDDFSKVIELDPYNLQGLKEIASNYLANCTNALEASHQVQTQIEILTKFRIDMQKAYAFLEQGNYKEAIVESEKYVNTYSSLSVIFSFRGECYYLIHNFSVALQNLNKAIELALNDSCLGYHLNCPLSVIYYYRANAHIGLNNHQQGVFDLQKAIELDPYFEKAKKELELQKNYLRDLQKYNQDLAIFERQQCKIKKAQLRAQLRANTLDKVSSSHAKAVARIRERNEKRQDTQTWLSKMMAQGKKTIKKSSIDSQNQSAKCNERLKQSVESFTKDIHNKTRRYHQQKANEEAARIRTMTNTTIKPAHRYSYPRKEIPIYNVRKNNASISSHGFFNYQRGVHIPKQLSENAKKNDGHLQIAEFFANQGVGNLVTTLGSAAGLGLVASSILGSVVSDAIFSTPCY